MEASEEDSSYNPVPQSAPGSEAAEGQGHNVLNSIPLSIFPIALDKFCICLAGLPGRGKTHVARRLARYLEFFHAVPVKLFSFNEFRRDKYGPQENVFFDQDNTEAREKRQVVYEEIYSQTQNFLRNNKQGLVILDSTNATFERRKHVRDLIHETGAKVLFIEMEGYDEKSMKTAYRNIIEHSPDYENVPKEKAIADFQSKVEQYIRCYEPIDSGKYPIESKWAYIKCDLYNKHFTVHNVRGYLEQKIAHFVMNLRTEYGSSQFYLSRHGQSEYNQIGRIGGDSGLSKHGWVYAKKLADFVDSHITKDNESGDVRAARLWTSTMRRTKETAHFIRNDIIKRRYEDNPDLEHEWVQMRARAWHHLDELFAGSCDGMTYEEIEQQFPDEFKQRSKDKLAYRYPRGESYLDVIARLEPMIIEMERHREPLLIIGHQGILRIIYAFYMGLKRSEAPYVSIPLNTVIHLKPGAFHCEVNKHKLYTIALATDGQDEPQLAGKALIDAAGGEKKSLEQIKKEELINDPQSH